MTGSTGARSRRLSLTKTQRAAGAGAELLALLVDVTEDGRLSDDEVARLKAWLDENHDTDIPAVAYLGEAVERVLADNVITEDEREYLLDTIEAVLPPDARAKAKAKRSPVRRMCQTDGCTNLLREDAPRSRRWCDECRDVRRAPNKYREGDVAGLDVGFAVAGVQYEGRQDVIRAHVKDGDSLVLVREPGNPYDANAVQVRLENGMQIGFVPRQWRRRAFDEDDEPQEHTNVEIARLLDAGQAYTAYCWKVLTGGAFLGVFAIAKFDGYLQRHPARVQVARERPDSGLAWMLNEQEARTTATVSARPTRAMPQSSMPPLPTSRSSTPIVVLLVAAGLVALAAVAMFAR
jgi:HIRAN domain